MNHQASTAPICVPAGCGSCLPCSGLRQVDRAAQWVGMLEAQRGQTNGEGAARAGTPLGEGTTAAILTAHIDVSRCIIQRSPLGAALAFVVDSYDEGAVEERNTSVILAATIRFGRQPAALQKPRDKKRSARCTLRV